MPAGSFDSRERKSPYSKAYDLLRKPESLINALSSHTYLFLLITYYPPKFGNAIRSCKLFTLNMLLNDVPSLTFY